MFYFFEFGIKNDTPTIIFIPQPVPYYPTYCIVKASSSVYLQTNTKSSHSI